MRYGVCAGAEDVSKQMLPMTFSVNVIYSCLPSLMGLQEANDSSGSESSDQSGMKAEDAHTSDSSDESMPDQDAQDGESDSHEVGPTCPFVPLYACKNITAHKHQSPRQFQW